MNPYEGIGALFPLGGIFAVFLGIRYFVCLARCETRGPWTSPLGFGWLIFVCLLLLPPRGTGLLNESELATSFLGLSFRWAAALLWSYATLVFVATEVRRRAIVAHRI